METQEAMQRLYDSFDMEKVDKTIEKRAKEEIKNQSEPMPVPVDLYQRDRNRIRDVNAKSFPKGSSAIVSTAVNAVVDGMGGEGLARAYKRAQDDADSLADQGERGRAELRRKQYMEENFLPAVEIVVNSTSPDELLNSKSGLEELDKYVLLPTKGSGKGYTAAYIRQAYGNQLGQVAGRSDDAVRSGVMRINALLDDGQIRAAFGMANKLKEQIDKGERQSDDIDYELIARVVSFYSA